MSSKLIVVIGATGGQGGSVARLFAKDGWRVRGITRNPDKPSNAALRELGIELVAANLDDPVSLVKAFEGANAIFAVTDFWQFVMDPAVHATAAQSGKMPNEVAFDREVEQGRNIVDAAAKHLSTLERFVFSSLSDTKKWTKGKIVWNLHFDDKAVILNYLHDKHPALAAKSSFLQMGMYMSNYRMQSPVFSPVKQADGSFTLQGRGSAAHLAPLVNPQNDTGYFVKALVAAESGTTVLGTCKEMPYDDFWRMWAEIKGVQLKIEDVGVKLPEGTPEWMRLEMEATVEYCSEYGWTGGDPEVKRPEEIGVEMGKLTDVETWLREEKFEGLM
ncbi:hypothetical protein B0A48_01438 [Cryoendolithus antarcticus]|uniref:NmrA-like domain-containing protein n=1 Tax=Cryoendolithus antarcticus TaxID=1507870 RepID=A0A1V8TTA9_9PEZI|nr:hypothetical protein B0A48_01438 [Cryoendolithus antarcticus]